MLWFFIFLFFFAPNVFAYTDQITVKAEEAWTAAVDVLKPYGFHKKDEQKHFIETNWIQDRVVRKGRWLLKNVASQTNERRYRITLQITQRAYDSEIEIRGTFQERPMDPNPTRLSWQKVKPQTEELDVERALFMRILNRLELAHSAGR